jgi:DNA repair exonuclease SbcCD ATPase subunit
LSGGEQQMVSFAIGKALADLASIQVKGDINLQILDEPFSMLAGRNSEALVDYWSQEDKVILLISNEQSLKNLISDRVHIIKEGGISQIWIN